MDSLSSQELRDTYDGDTSKAAKSGMIPLLRTSSGSKGSRDTKGSKDSSGKIKRKWSRKKTILLCRSADTVPAVGGIEVDPAHLSFYPILPPYVVMFEPTQEDIWLSPRMRAIFLNQPLKEWEQIEIAKLKTLMLKEMGLAPEADVPRWILPHLSRLLQQTKYKAAEAVKIYPKVYTERVENLPITYDEIRAAMDTGCVYWHGRDTKCRPLLVIRIGRAAKLMSNAELVQKLFLFTMEFAVRHLLIPGRVENWNVLIDCEGIGTLPGMMKCKEFGQAIATTLGKVYSGRMIWTKILNFPKGWTYSMLRVAIEGIVSALGKSDKVSFVTNAGKEFADNVELGQLEKWAGGIAPDMPADKIYPYRMFADPVGYLADLSPTSKTLQDAGADVHATPLYCLADLEFREGLLWADCLEQQTSWKQKAARLPLPPGPAEAVGVRPVRDLPAWRECMHKYGQYSMSEHFGTKMSEDSTYLSSTQGLACSGDKLMKQEKETKATEEKDVDMEALARRLGAGYEVDMKAVKAGAWQKGYGLEKEVKAGDAAGDQQEPACLLRGNADADERSPAKLLEEVETKCTKDQDGGGAALRRSLNVEGIVGLTAKAGSDEVDACRAEMRPSRGSRTVDAEHSSIRSDCFFCSCSRPPPVMGPTVPPVLSRQLPPPHASRDRGA